MIHLLFIYDSSVVHLKRRTASSSASSSASKKKPHQVVHQVVHLKYIENI